MKSGGPASEPAQSARSLSEEKKKKKVQGLLGRKARLHPRDGGITFSPWRKVYENEQLLVFNSIFVDLLFLSSVMTCV